jgi:hypothetical protein
MKRTYIGCLVVLAAFVFGLGILFAKRNPNFGARKFDQAVWKQSRNTHANSPRMGMIHDLQVNYLYSEISREDVLKLLGSIHGKIN